MLPRLLTRTALTVPFFASRALHAGVERCLAERPPDLCFAYSSSMGQYLLGRDGLVRIQHFAELDSDKWRQYAQHSRRPGRWIYQREATRLLEFETRIAREFDLSLVVSEVERELFLRWIPEARVGVLPNGVDSDYFAPQGDQDREQATCIFTGVMDYEPNVDAVLHFVRDSWPAIRAGQPGARFLVVGAAPVPEIQKLHHQDGIQVTGRVPDTRPYFQRAAIAVAPLRIARGIQNKVLEAMSMGLPVVSSSAAAQGITARSGTQLCIADGGAATAAAVLGLMRDPGARRQVGRAARAFVLEHYRWGAVLAQLDQRIADARARRAPVRG